MPQFRYVFARRGPAVKRDLQRRKIHAAADRTIGRRAGRVRITSAMSIPNGAEPQMQINMEAVSKDLSIGPRMNSITRNSQNEPHMDPA